MNKEETDDEHDWKAERMSRGLEVDESSSQWSGVQTVFAVTLG